MIFRPLPVRKICSSAYMAAFNKEIFIQSGYNYNAIDSIFIGGGTPTMLSEYMLSSLLEHIYKISM